MAADAGTKVWVLSGTVAALVVLVCWFANDKTTQFQKTLDTVVADGKETQRLVAEIRNSVTQTVSKNKSQDTELADMKANLSRLWDRVFTDRAAGARP